MEKIPNTMSESDAWSVVITSGFGAASMLIRQSKTYRESRGASDTTTCPIESPSPGR
jgi:uncharacterized membrane protein